MAENNVTTPSNSEVVASDEQNSQVQNGNNENNQEAPPAQGTNVWGVIKTLGVRMFFIYIIASLFRKSTAPSQTKDGVAQIPASNVFQAFMKIDMYVYISEEEEFSDFKNENALFWSKKGLTYGDWKSGPDGDGAFTKFGEIPISEAVQSNGSLYIHAYFVKAGKSPDPTDKGKYSKKTTTYRSKRLNRYKKRHFHNTVNLLTGQTSAHPDLIMKENSSSFEILSHWHPNLTLNLLDDHSPWIQGSIPQPLDEYIEFLPGLNKYYPVIFFNDYWNLNTDFTPVNHTTKVLNFSLTYAPISLFRWQLYAAQGMRNKWYSFLGSDMMEESDDDQDSLKTAFLETNPYLLALTIIVSIAHSIFEFLAFKNDIQFWKSRKSLEGLSVRSIFFNVFQSLIIVLYVLDNETNTVVRISVFIGLLIEIWKIKKVVNVKIDMENKLFGILPRLRLEDKSSYTQSQTKQYDLLAFKYLSWLLFPLLVAYSIYSLLYNEHRGWYSFVLSLLYGFLLTFGFIMMTPQLFINYKLKSVAHLPWRMLTYKALNTFIDDIFAFVIKMPTLYRIGCLRDDVIFFIYVYQRYIYRVDPKRINEFGTSQEMMVEQNGTAGGDRDKPAAIKDTPSEESVMNTGPKSKQEKKED